MMHPKKQRVHVIGGGVIGLSIAWELVRRGMEVTVLDEGEIGKGASWAGAGILPAAATRPVADPYERLKARSHHLHPVWAEQLRRETGIDTGYRHCGGIHLAMTKAEAATLAGNQYWWHELGIRHEALGARELVEAEPALAAAAEQMVGKAWLHPDESQLRNPRHLKALSLACQQRGVRLLPGRAVHRLDVRAGRVHAVITRDGEQLPTEVACVCAGAWARQFLLDLGFENGLMPIRGQMLLYRCPQPLLSRVVNVGHRYLVPRDDGYLLAGSIEEEVGYHCETTTEAIAQLRQWAESLVPQLRHAELERSWAGLRPGSFDGFPYIGPVPGADGAYVAAGHFRSGLHLSCATAELLADAIEGKPCRIELTPFRVARG
ncbi:MAG: D-amino-acid oxidase [Pirellulaceae bacterium]|nr:MAG: D-amino-acid oxidase [Pirellulaceae bacterium]